ncbi:MAG: hypothetical protein FWD06_07160 [Oscillospiraceae bacterium]|nr:hypothetical protein [Oscillospiraceae bacterium]
MKHTKRILALLLCVLLALGISAPATANDSGSPVASQMTIEIAESQGVITRTFNAIMRTVIILIMIFVLAVGVIWVYTNLRDIIRANLPAPSQHTPPSIDQPADQLNLDYHS